MRSRCFHVFSKPDFDFPEIQYHRKMSSWKFEQKIIDSHVEHSTIFHKSESIEMKPIVFPASEFALMKNFHIMHCVFV